MCEERLWCLGDNMENTHTCLQILDKSLEEGDKVLGLADVSWNCLVDHVGRQNGVCEHVVLFSPLVCVLQTRDQFLVLVLQLSRVRLFDPDVS
jgi:hypothetical protein